MFPCTARPPVLRLFPGPVVGFPLRILSWIRCEYSYTFSCNTESPGSAGHIRPASCEFRGVVVIGLRGIDECGHVRGKGKLDLFFFGDACGERYESEFWKCCCRLEKPPDLDPDEHRHGGGHDFTSERHRYGFQRRGRNVFGCHRCRTESSLPGSICAGERRKFLRQYLHYQ